MLCIHFPPGARGDFLAGVLLDQIIERDNYAVRQPSNYKKIHFVEDYSFLSDSNNITIRIDPNNNALNLVEIAYNNITKNKITDPLDDIWDKIYLYIVDIINRDKLVINYKTNYDYWIDYSLLNNLQFVEDLYILINKTTPDKVLLQSAIENITKQPSLPDDYKKLSNLIEFEIKTNLLGSNTRTFTCKEFINTTNFNDFLKLSKY